MFADDPDALELPASTASSEGKRGGASPCSREGRDREDVWLPRGDFSLASNAVKPLRQRGEKNSSSPFHKALKDSAKPDSIDPRALLRTSVTTCQGVENVSRRLSIAADR